MNKQEKTFPVIQTDRLILREVDFSDEQDAYIYLSDPEVMKHMGMEPLRDLDDVKEEIQWYSNIFNEGKGIRWGIALKENNKMIGSCGFHNLEKKHFRAEVGYELHKNFWRKGIAKEALQAIIEYGFKHMNFMRIQALVEPENIASRNLLSKLNFLEEGLLRKYEYTCGKFDDLYMYSILEQDL